MLVTGAWAARLRMSGKSWPLRTLLDNNRGSLTLLDLRIVCLNYFLNCKIYNTCNIIYGLKTNNQIETEHFYFQLIYFQFEHKSDMLKQHLKK